MLTLSFFNLSLHHSLPLLKERYNLLPYRNCQNFHQYHNMALLCYGTCVDTVITFLDLWFKKCKQELSLSTLAVTPPALTIAGHQHTKV